MLCLPEALLSSVKKEGKGRGKLTEPGGWLLGCEGEDDWEVGMLLFVLLSEL